MLNRRASYDIVTNQMQKSSIVESSSSSDLHLSDVISIDCESTMSLPRCPDSFLSQLDHLSSGNMPDLVADEGGSGGAVGMQKKKNNKEGGGGRNSVYLNNIGKAVSVMDEFNSLYEKQIREYEKEGVEPLERARVSGKTVEPEFYD